MLQKFRFLREKTLIEICFSEQINLNEELVIELEATMANFESEMEHQRKMYESKLKLLEAKIKQAEDDRDNALKQSIKQTDTDNPKVNELFLFFRGFNI